MNQSKYKLNELLSYFLPRKRMTGKVWVMKDHQGWGNRIGWFDTDELKLSGHTTPRPEIGDELQAETESHKVMRYVFTDVEYVRDPRDMWFATVEQLGYVNQKQLNHRWKR
jgi:hypothetical protein